MTNDGVYQIWRAEHSPWSRWVKPVIFAFLGSDDLSHNQYPVEEWTVPLHADTAIIVDLPGAEGVSAGIALARTGYLPVLLYNACPYGTYEEPLESPPVTVDMSSILTALCGATKELASFGLSAQAPPAFLLDGNRRGVHNPHGPGWFDNRSFVTPSDFPSAQTLRGHGISRVIVVQSSRDFQTDLRYVLLQLQRQGITTSTQAPWKQWAPQGLVVEPPNFFVAAWEWLRRKFGYRRDPFHGSFGAVVPPSSS